MRLGINSVVYVYVRSFCVQFVSYSLTCSTFVCLNWYARMHQITTVHGEIGDKERWGMDGPESIASRPGGGRSGEVDGGVAANQGFDVSSSFPLRFVLWSCSARRIMVQYAMTVSNVVVPVR